MAKVRAGSEILMSGNIQEYNELKKAIKDRTLDESTLDENLLDIMKFKLSSHRAKGYIPTGRPDLNAHAKIAEKAAEEGMILLKNER